MPVNLNSGKLALLVVAVVLTPLIFYYKFYLSGAGVEMSSLNVLADEVPASLEEKQKNVVSVEGYADVNGFKVFYRDVALPRGLTPPTKQVLLLHGQAFSSETWEKLGTLTLLGALGHRAVAVDLPGYGKSTSSKVKDTAAFMETLVEVLKLRPAPVIISPSMSGKFSLPYLVSHSEEVGGYIPVAPVDTDAYTNEFHSINVPTLIVVGELDNSIGPVSVKNLSLLPNHALVTLPKAKHPAYLDQPKLWHKLLYNFLKDT